MEGIKCYCCSGKLFDICCYPYLSGQKKAETAEVLMRSRYTAFATQSVKYLIDTTHSSTQSFYRELDIKDWAVQNSWQKLEVLKITETTVAFKAYYKDTSGKNQCHYELSTFKNENSSWYYVDGVFE